MLKCLDSPGAVQALLLKVLRQVGGTEDEGQVLLPLSLQVTDDVQHLLTIHFSDLIRATAEQQSQHEEGRVEMLHTTASRGQIIQLAADSSTQFTPTDPLSARRPLKGLSDTQAIHQAGGAAGPGKQHRDTHLHDGFLAGQHATEVSHVDLPEGGAVRKVAAVCADLGQDCGLV